MLSEHVDAVLDVLRNAATPLALGERLYSRWDFKHIVASGAVDIVQPDPSHAGGITETRKIATMAEAYDVALALHCPLGPIALATCLQIDAVTYNAFIQEQSLGIHYKHRHDLLPTCRPVRLAYDDGMVTSRTAPPGIEVNEEFVRERPKGTSLRNPVWRHADGSFAEW